MTITFTPVFGFGQFSTDHPPGADWINQRNADFLLLDGKFATATFSAGGVLFGNASNKIDKDTANFYFDPTNKTLMVGANSTVAKRFFAKRGTSADSSGQPAKNWVAILYNATNAVDESGLLIKTNWFAAGSTLLELGNDLVGGAYTPFWQFFGDGSVVGGSATGGAKGLGTINAKALYDDNTLLTDFVFEKDYPLISLDDLRTFYEQHKHLPTIKGRADWEREGKFSLGALTSMLWETVEVQARYLVALHERVTVLESR